MGGEIKTFCIMLSSWMNSSKVTVNFFTEKCALPLGGSLLTTPGGFISFGPPLGITGCAHWYIANSKKEKRKILKIWRMTSGLFVVQRCKILVHHS